jgi:predicted transcriptional regulator
MRAAAFFAAEAGSATVRLTFQPDVAMTKEEIAAVFERAKSWPQEKQEEAVGVLLAIENDEYDDCSDMTEEDWAALDEASAAIDRGEFLTEEEMKDFFAKLRA